MILNAVCVLRDCPPMNQQDVMALIVVSAAIVAVAALIGNRFR